jgi:group II intron reverse transcriptase/maturase
VDGQSWSDYGKNLQENLLGLLQRAKSGSYFAPPVKRVHIPKGDGKETRGIGMPTIEDKVLQRAIARLLEPIFEQDFKCFSYGFRPGRSAHQALACIWSQCMNQGIGWILEVDIRKYFDTLKKEWLRKFLDRRVRDGVIRRLIGKWLKAGVMEELKHWSPSHEGTPQGGVISPLLGNIYLHFVQDLWIKKVVVRKSKGSVLFRRYADDSIVCFQRNDDAEAYRVLFKRFEKYGLSLHPEKTRLVPFGRPEETKDDQTNGPKPGTFDFWVLPTTGVRVGKGDGLFGARPCGNGSLVALKRAVNGVGRTYTSRCGSKWSSWAANSKVTLGITALLATLPPCRGFAGK